MMLPKLIRRRTDTINVRHDNEVTHTKTTMFELTYGERVFTLALTHNEPLSWEPVKRG